jgi:hypothetical protein
MSATQGKYTRRDVLITNQQVFDFLAAAIPQHEACALPPALAHAVDAIDSLEGHGGVERRLHDEHVIRTGRERTQKSTTSSDSSVLAHLVRAECCLSTHDVNVSPAAAARTDSRKTVVSGSDRNRSSAFRRCGRV